MRRASRFFCLCTSPVIIVEPPVHLCYSHIGRPIRWWTAVYQRTCRHTSPVSLQSPLTEGLRLWTNTYRPKRTYVHVPISKCVSIIDRIIMAARPAMQVEPAILFCCWCLFPPIFIYLFFHRLTPGGYLADCNPVFATMLPPCLCYNYDANYATILDAPFNVKVIIS